MPDTFVCICRSVLDYIVQGWFAPRSRASLANLPFGGATRSPATLIHVSLLVQTVRESAKSLQLFALVLAHRHLH